ncbi:DUF4296 domain-containing protein [Daejeonella sp.]|jgi:hypothetical protein|uniref:DUF4296 domain-containing protein n=1 Tax=Daejeonella sp. TaxID=2805397 RepID=UPI0037BE908B
MKVFKLFFLALVLIVSCRDNDVPKDLIEEQRMIQIIADLHIIDGYMASLVYTDSTRINGKNFYTTVYKSHKTTKAVYEKSLKYYSMDPVRLDSMYNRVEVLLTNKERKLNKIQLKNPEIKQ